MKFFLIASLLCKIEDDNYDFISNATIAETRGLSLTFNPWGYGTVVDAEESFPTFCSIAYGFEPIAISQEEYKQLNLDGVCFFDKERSTDIRSRLMKQRELLSKKMVNS